MSMIHSAIILISLVLLLSHPEASLIDCLHQTCGNLKVSYPFKLASMPSCPSFSPSFELQCNTSSGKLYFNSATNLNSDVLQLQVTEILDDSLILDITSLSSVLTTNKSSHSHCESAPEDSSLILPSFPGPYFISDDNKFVSFGLCTLGLLFTAAKFYNDSSETFLDFEVGGCSVSSPGDEICGNHTCCFSPLPTGSSPRFAYYAAEVDFLSNSTSCSRPCSSNYANLFNPNYTNFEDEIYRLKLKWALPSNQTTGLKESSDYACASNANPIIVGGVPGYLCSCSPGYTGDGYSKGSGCSDINECDLNSQNDCILGRATCQNTKGNYTCKCNSRFYVGDGLTNGSGCRFSPTVRNAFVVSCAILGLALLIGGFIFLVVWWRLRRKRKYFMLNGGLQLQAYIASAGGKETTRLFTAEELKAATENFSDQMKLGVGGFGTVFKGMLEDGRVVAIKKANRGEPGDNEQFLNEMAILTQINHRHIVRLLGCCLETATPLLVYEYVSNGNVAENLETEGARLRGWEQRLNVARQTAEALAYLHSAASPPILHRDVKSANILLDDNLDAKVADFGVSRLVPEGMEHVSTAVQGTLGYLDPEYFQTLQLTDKSDVYSLGVVLVELLTGLKAIDSRTREPCFANLALLFIERMRQGRLDELIDPRLESPSSIPPSAQNSETHASIMAVATLARRCLALQSAERPSMSHVVDELHRITQSFVHSTAEEDDEEPLSLLPSKQKDLDYEAGAVVAQNTQYCVQSGSNSMSIDTVLLNTPTVPR